MNRNQKIILTTGSIMVALFIGLGWTVYKNHQANQLRNRLMVQRQSPTTSGVSSSSSMSFDTSTSSNQSTSTSVKQPKDSSTSNAKQGSVPKTGMTAFKTNATFGANEKVIHGFTKTDANNQFKQLQNNYLLATDEAKPNETRLKYVVPIVEYEYVQLASNQYANADTLTQALLPLSRQQSNGFYLNREVVKHVLQHLSPQIEKLYAYAKVHATANH